MSVTETELTHVKHEHIDTFDSDDDKIVINVGGQRHVTLTSTLLKKPGTRLWHLVMRNNGSGNRNREFFFDRHPGVFSSVIDYYRTDELHVPLDVCGAAVKRELDFWQIEDTLIKACCWISYSSHIGNERTLRKFDQETQLQKDLLELDSLKGWRKKQMQLWLVLDHPRSSTLAMVFAVTSFLFVLASITGFCLETHPSMYEKLSVNRTCGSSAIKPTVIYQHKPFLHVLDYVCTIFFTAELLLRMTVTPSKRRFFRSPMNLIDILALLPLYVQIGLKVMDHENCLKGSRYVIETIFILRIIRVFRIFHLVRQYKALQILIHAMRASFQELMMLSIFLLIAMLVFSTLIFYAERRGSFTSLDDLNSTSNNNFESIPVGFWWSIITMTTVGYGDTFPKTPMGFLIGSLCAVSGVLLLALTIPVMSSNFTLFYMHARSREDIGTGGDAAAENGVMPSSSTAAAAVLKEVGCSDPSDHGGSQDVTSDDQHHQQPDYHISAPVDGDDYSDSKQAHSPIPTESSIP